MISLAFKIRSDPFSARHASSGSHVSFSLRIDGYLRGEMFATSVAERVHGGF